MAIYSMTGLSVPVFGRPLSGVRLFPSVNILLGFEHLDHDIVKHFAETPFNDIEFLQEGLSFILNFIESDTESSYFCWLVPSSAVEIENTLLSPISGESDSPSTNCMAHFCHSDHNHE